MIDVKNDADCSVILSNDMKSIENRQALVVEGVQFLLIMIYRSVKKLTELKDKRIHV